MACCRSLNPDSGFHPCINCQLMQKGLSMFVEGQMFWWITIPVDGVPDEIACCSYGHIPVNYNTGEKLAILRSAANDGGDVTRQKFSFTGSQTGHALGLDAETKAV